MAAAQERRRILYALEITDGPLSAEQLAERSGMDVPRAQSHLSLLRRRGYVRNRRPRKWVLAPERPHSPPR